MLVTVRTGRHKDKVRRHVEMTMKILLREVLKKVEEDNLNEIKNVVDDIISNIVQKEYRKEAGDGISYFANILEKSVLEDNGLEYVYLPPPPPSLATKKSTKRNTLWKSARNLTNDDKDRGDRVEYEYVTVSDTYENEWDEYIYNKQMKEKEEKDKKDARLLKRRVSNPRKSISPPSPGTNSILGDLQHNSVANSKITLNDGSTLTPSLKGSASKSVDSKRRSTNWGFNVSFQGANLINSGGMTSGMISKKTNMSKLKKHDGSDSDSDTEGTDEEEDEEEQFEDENDDEYELRMMKLVLKLKRKRKRKRKKLRKIKDLVFISPTSSEWLGNPTPGWHTKERDLIMLQSGVRAVVTRLKVSHMY